MRALVLSGGGAKGSYQIGVWKALKKSNIKFDIVTGTSSGALNATLITQNTYRRAINIWKNISFKVLFQEDVEQDKLKIYKMYGKNILKEGGMNTDELHKILKDNIKYKKLMQSKINLGIVTYNLSKRKAIELEKKDIPEEKFTDYLLASATCFPAFKKKLINGNKYIDGGYYDNLPINLAIKMGATEIISVDLKAPGVKRPTKNKNKVKILTIKPNNKLTNFLNFYEDGAIRNMKLGYNDTMKALKKFEGKYFTFKKNSIKKNIKIHEETFIHIVMQILNIKKIKENFQEILPIIYNINSNADYDFFLRIMERLGKDLELDETKIYTRKSFNKTILKKLKALSKEKEISIRVKNILKFHKYLKRKEYNKIKNLAILLPKEFLEAVYIYTIREV